MRSGERRFEEGDVKIISLFQEEEKLVFSPFVPFWLNKSPFRQLSQPEPIPILRDFAPNRGLHSGCNRGRYNLFSGNRASKQLPLFFVGEFLFSIGFPLYSSPSSVGLDAPAARAAFPSFSRTEGR